MPAARQTDRSFALAVLWLVCGSSTEHGPAPSPGICFGSETYTTGRNFEKQRLEFEFLVSYLESNLDYLINSLRRGITFFIVVIIDFFGNRVELCMNSQINKFGKKCEPRL